MSIIKPNSKLRRKYNDISESVHNNDAKVRITQKGKEEMFAVSMDDYERLSKIIG